MVIVTGGQSAEGTIRSSLFYEVWEFPDILIWFEISLTSD